MVMASTPSRHPVQRRFGPWLALTTVALVACGGDADTETGATVPPVADTSSESTSEPTGTATTTTLAVATTTAASPNGTVAATTTVATASTVPPTSGATTEDTMDQNTNPSVPASDSEVVQTAIADLRTRIDAPDADITVVSVEEVEWSDGSIGCPQPGMSYTQAIVNGTKIVLEYDGVTYDYHQGGSRPVFYCAPRLDR